MSTLSQEGVSCHSRCERRVSGLLRAPSHEHVGSLSDGSYVSVPSPLGKIKSMTKGSEAEPSVSPLPPTHVTPRLAGQHAPPLGMIHPHDKSNFADTSVH